MADAGDLKSPGGNTVRIRLPPRAFPVRNRRLFGTLSSGWSEQRTHNALVGGSNPSGSIPPWRAPHQKSTTFTWWINLYESSRART